MKKYFVTVAVLSGLLAFAGSSLAADQMTESSGHAYFHLDGGYVFGEEGSGIEDDIDPGEVFPGEGLWISGYAGYTMPSGWDWRVGAGFADLSQGDEQDNGPSNIYSVDDTKMFNLDADVGFVYDMGRATVRPFVGVRYLEWKQDQGYHPDVPLDCCFMDSKFDGVGPRLGFDASMPVSDMFDLVGGADVSVLFGEIDFSAGTGFPAASGSDSRTALTIGGYAGVDISLTESISFGARYRLMYLDGTSFDNAGINSGGPNGKASNLLHGPSASLTIGF